MSRTSKLADEWKQQIFHNRYFIYVAKYKKNYNYSNCIHFTYKIYLD